MPKAMLSADIIASAISTSPATRSLFIISLIALATVNPGTSSMIVPIIILLGFVIEVIIDGSKAKDPAIKESIKLDENFGVPILL